MVPVKNILCLLPLVMAVVSQDRHTACGLVEELVQAGEVTHSSCEVMIYLNSFSLFQASIAHSMCNIYEFVNFCPDSCTRMRYKLFNLKGTTGSLPLWHKAV